MSINLKEVEKNLPSEVIDLCKEFSVTNNLMMRMKMYTFMATSIISSPIEDKDYLLEIGTYHGLTAIFIAKLLNIIGKSNKVISVDPFDRLVGARVVGNYNKYMANLVKYNVKEQCLVMSAFSHQAAPFLKGDIPFIILDGGHLYEDIKRDILLYLPKLKVGGIAYLHDNDEKRYPGVTRAISELIRGNEKYEILLDEYYFIVKRLF
jgi:cephalosporin hydroxylase